MPPLLDVHIAMLWICRSRTMPALLSQSFLSIFLLSLSVSPLSGGCTEDRCFGECIVWQKAGFVKDTDSNFFLVQRRLVAVCASYLSRGQKSAEEPNSPLRSESIGLLQTDVAAC